MSRTIPNTTSLELSPELSIVMPCYNEVLGIESFLQTWLRKLRSAAISFEILIINDGSTDGSGRILDKLRRENKELRVLHQLNVGHSITIRRGYELARGKFIAQVDSNGSLEVSDFLRLWAARTQFHLVVGRRTHRIDSWVRRANASISSKLVEVIFDFQVRDPDTPCRIMDGYWLKQFLNRMPKSVANPNLTLTILFKRIAPGGVGEVDVPFRMRTYGKPKSGWAASGSVALHSITDIMHLRWASWATPQLQGVHPEKVIQ